MISSSAGKHSATVHGVVDNFSDHGAVGIDVHAIAGAKVSAYSLVSDLKCVSAEFGIASGLNGIDRLQTVPNVLLLHWLVFHLLPLVVRMNLPVDEIK
jgi:hypothetical protein